MTIGERLFAYMTVVIGLTEITIALGRPEPIWGFIGTLGFILFTAGTLVQFLGSPK